jgi:RHS repeat-associated protein
LFEQVFGELDFAFHGLGQHVAYLLAHRVVEGVRFFGADGIDDVVGEGRVHKLIAEDPVRTGREAVEQAAGAQKVDVGESAVEEQSLYAGGETDDVVQELSSVVSGAETQGRTLAGAVTRRHFDPFGNQRDASVVAWPDSHGFLNKPIDGFAGTTHLGDRDYDSITGRFLTVDPLLNAADPVQANGYSYASNSPVNLSDPSGDYAVGCGPNHDDQCTSAPTNPSGGGKKKPAPETNPYQGPTSGNTGTPTPKHDTPPDGATHVAPAPKKPAKKPAPRPRPSAPTKRAKSSPRPTPNPSAGCAAPEL